ncbi:MULTISPECIES: GntR family transcriptional regulator [Halanaerobium]|uniref:GntR family transcriptional regulator of arabinose operon n=1 Tax=Halanaerobium saccharolyticum TaxID=43595 RepID=A0A4R6RUX0_9FIRM|nr:MULTISPECIES: GntR family transcriptional regulator [Halanaerobium]PUU87040.1 MAG: araR [Halanaerobium sp.]TDP90085.1 GntR family transcriptional regulator of arabinose operon [Halanaerobium saccharolyticum]
MKKAKYQQIIDYYKDYIEHHELSDGDLLPSESDVAEEFDFSRDTVRRALKELEKEKVVSRERGKGTFFKDEQNTVKEKRIAVITTYLSNYIFPNIISGIEEVVSSKHYTLNLANTDNDPNKERKHLRKVIDNQVDGLIIEPTKSAVDTHNMDLYQELKEKNIPFVMLNAYYRELDPSYAIVNDYKGGYKATQYLLQLGHTSIAGIFKEDDLQGIFRLKGFKKALSDYDLDPEAADIGTYITSQISSYPYHCMDKMLSHQNQPTAVVCYNDEIAVDVVKAIIDNGLKVPEDISVVSFDDSILATATNVRLTSVRHPKEELGRHAARLLFNMIEIGIKKPRFLYDPELVVRDSCKELRRR